MIPGGRLARATKTLNASANSGCLYTAVQIQRIHVGGDGRRVRRNVLEKPESCSIKPACSGCCCYCGLRRRRCSCLHQTILQFSAQWHKHDAVSDEPGRYECDPSYKWSG